MLRKGILINWAEAVAARRGRTAAARAKSMVGTSYKREEIGRAWGTDRGSKDCVL